MLTIAFCYALAFFEGFDSQAVGVAAPRLGPAFGLGAGQLGWFFSIGTVGLIIGAAVGGRLSDRFGRKAVLVGSVAAFGAMSACTALAPDYATLMALRFLTGLGLGGALPNLIAMVAESAAPRWRNGLLSALYACLPAGGAGASLFGAAGRADGWRLVFEVGGYGPLALTPLMILFLSDNRPVPVREGASPPQPRASIGAALFSERRGASTLLLSAAFFAAILTLSVLVNWLPTLLISRGLSRAEASTAQMAFSLFGAGGGVATSLLAHRLGLRTMAAAAFACAAAAMVLMASAPVGLMVSAGVAGVAGAAIAMVQGVLYGLSPAVYPTAVRGTGVGAAVSVGRLGAVAGPVLVGVLLAGSASPQRVLSVLIPVIAAGGVAAYSLAVRLAHAARD